jgi:DNA-binding NarL/FixJ family response regulator
VDLVVLDMIMDGGMDGLDTYRAILRFRPAQRAVIVSGYSETDRVQKALALGAAHYLKKPYLVETLGIAVRNALLRHPGPSGGTTESKTNS